MPDLLTHLIIGLCIAKITKFNKGLILLGTLLPDVIIKASLLEHFFTFPPNFFGYRLLVFHSPLGLLALTIIISLFFAYPKKAFISAVSIGWISHLLLDLTTRHLLETQTYLFMPFSYGLYELGWFWPEQYYYLFFASLLLLIITYHKEIALKLRS